MSSPRRVVLFACSACPAGTNKKSHRHVTNHRRIREIVERYEEKLLKLAEEDKQRPPTQATIDKLEDAKEEFDDKILGQFDLEVDHGSSPPPVVLPVTASPLKAAARRRVKMMINDGTPVIEAEFDE
jgi:hypothetical protein